MLKFVFGASGSGKSTFLYQKIIEKSLAEPERNFLIIVPDQFTMQTQLDIVKLHPAHGIMNIDAVSFGRLSHRIFDETGEKTVPVLDDTGKSLILRRVADLNIRNLPVIGKSMHKSGYIDEVKSTVSEFMQYGISPDDMDSLISCAKSKGALCARLKDIQLIYREFKEYIRDRFVTSEETLDILCRRLPESKLVRHSCIVIDGFTGFTPIQYRVIEKLIQLADEVTVAVTTDGKSDPYVTSYGEQELFALSKKTIADLEKTAYNALLQSDPGHTPNYESWLEYRRTHNDDYVINDIPVIRLKNSPELSFLERHIFRYDSVRFNPEGSSYESIHIAECSSIQEETRQVCIGIRKLIREKNCFFRDIAVICSNIETYAEVIEREADRFDIPVFVDKTCNITLNPFIEYIRSALEIVINDYSFESVFHYLRSGMTDFDPEDIDLLDNYVRALGIRGRKRWSEIFTRPMPGHYGVKDDAAEVKFIERMNLLRSRVTTELDPLFNAKAGTVAELSEALYNFIVAGNAADKLSTYAHNFDIEGDAVRSGEYSQIYADVMSLLDQTVALMGDEKLKIEEYRDILDAGFGEIQIGTIPGTVDRIIVGDMERTRLSGIKYLFFTGVGDNSIPRHTGTGGIISDIDRQFLTDAQQDVEMAPTPRQQMYIQRFYLYTNLTKPTDGLFLSWARTGNDGKSIRPAYLLQMLMRMYPGLEISSPETARLHTQMETEKDGMEYVARSIRTYADGYMTEQEKSEFLTLYGILDRKREKLSDGGQSGTVNQADDNHAKLKTLTDAAFARHHDSNLSEVVAEALYGTCLENSVSRLEMFAACCYEHFVKYGLGLDERSEFDFETSDLGNIFHGVLEKFALRLEEMKLDWMTFTNEQGEEILNDVLEEYTQQYGDTILFSSARNQYLIERMHRVLSRTVDTLQYQLKKGSFLPDDVEVDFSSAGSIEETDISLSDGDKDRISHRMKLHGRIDRIDTASDDAGNVYVKVIDYKTGKKDFNVCALYYGLQLQLVLYMRVAAAIEKKKNPDKNIVPAAILYYRVNDPVIESDAEMSVDEINGEIRKKLKMSGAVNSDDNVIHMLDKEFTDKSDCIPVARNAKGAFTAASEILSREDFKDISEFTASRLKKCGQDIMSGDIAVNPYQLGINNACTWCSFHSICGFDNSMPGFGSRLLPNMKNDEAMTAIKDENKKNQVKAVSEE